MPRKMLKVGLAVLLGAVLLGATGCDRLSQPPTPAHRDDFRIGLVTDVGTVRDGTFNELAHRGALRAAESFGLDYTYRESIDETHYSFHLEDLLADGRNVIITVGFFMTDFTLEQALANPDVYFIGVDQFFADPPPNLLGLQFEEDEGGFLVGALAGMMTKSGTVGVLGGERIPPVVRFVNGFANGARYTNPEVRVLQVFANSFIDAEFGRRTAREWVGEEDADVIFGAAGLTGSSAIFEAAGLGSWVIGVDQDEYRTTFRDGALDGSERVLTSAVKRVDNGVYRAISAILDGTFTGGVEVLSTSECGLGYAPFHEAAPAVPANVQARLSAIWSALAGGTLRTGASGAADDVPPEPMGDDGPPVAEDAPVFADCDLG